MSSIQNNVLKDQAKQETLHPDILSSEYSEEYLLEKLDRSAEIAAFYGFVPIKPLSITREDKTKASCFSEQIKNKSRSSTQRSSYNKHFEEARFTPEEKASLWRIYKKYEMNNASHPVMLYFKKPKSGSVLSGKYRSGLAIIGSEAGMAEVLSIKTALAILADHGIKDTYIEINCTGDKESVCRFEKELNSYLRKNIENIPQELKQSFKKDIWKILWCKDERCKEFIENAPQSISFLSPSSIQHFKEVLEYLETLEIPYKINNCLVGHRNYCPQLVFEIKENGNEKNGKNSIRAVGHRHDYFSKKMGLKKDIPAIITDLVFQKSPSTKTTKRKRKPKFYFVQIGPQAKVKSLNVIEDLRKAGIHVSHSLTEDKLTNQIATAEKLKVSSLIIMGHKEVMENTAIVRDMETRFQETVPIDGLASYLKKQG